MKKFIIGYVTALFSVVFLSIFSPIVSAENTDLMQTDEEIIKSKLIENSYIVTFRGPDEGFSYVVQEPKKDREKVPFGMHSTGQSKEELADFLNIKGEIISIFDAINAIHVIMDAKEAAWLSKQDYVLAVEQDITGIVSAIQNNPGWGLDRIDEQSANLDNNYVYAYSGAGRTIYVLDSGLNLDLPAVQAEFGNRASVFWDVNGGTGNDCHGHGSRVSSAAAGNTYGVAKGANLIMVKITTGCTGSSLISTWILAFNWLAVNADAGTIVNLSSNTSWGVNNCPGAFTDLALEAAITAAHDAPLCQDSCRL